MTSVCSLSLSLHQPSLSFALLSMLPYHSFFMREKKHKRVKQHVPAFERIVCFEFFCDGRKLAHGRRWQKGGTFLTAICALCHGRPEATNATCPGEGRRGDWKNATPFQDAENPNRL